MKKPENRIFTVPNVISIIRIICIPFFVYFFHKGGLTDIIIAGAILICSGITDLFDGVLARKLNQVTNLGKVLDPIADKLTEVAIAVLLFIEFRGSVEAIYRNFLSWIFLFFIAKELVMLIIGGILLLCKVKPVAAEIYGKISTFSFYVIMVAILVFGRQIGALPKLVKSLSWMVLPEWITVALVITAALLAVVAFFSYFPPVYRALKESKAEKRAALVKDVEEESFEEAFAKTEIPPRVAKVVSEPEISEESVVADETPEYDPGAISFKKVVEQRTKEVSVTEEPVVEDAVVVNFGADVEETIEAVIDAIEKEENHEVEDIEVENIEVEDIEVEEDLETEEPVIIETPEVKEPVAEEKTEQEKKDFVDSLLDEILNDIKNKEN